MRTFKILAGGWLIGGAVIMLLAALDGATSGVHGAPVFNRGLPSVRPEVGRPADARPALQRSGGQKAVRTATLPQTAARESVLRTSLGATFILIPVDGVTAEHLKDTYTQARGGGRTHHAIDILAPHGTPVVAAVDGTIRKLFFSKGGGITIYQFDQAEQLSYFYAHLDRYADGIAEGQFVSQGTVIGYVGVTGNAPPGTPHLHFAIEVLPPTKEWWKGEPVNPYPLLMGVTTTRASMLP